MMEYWENTVKDGKIRTGMMGGWSIGMIAKTNLERRKTRPPFYE
jgi:hypothetical protein